MSEAPVNNADNTDNKTAIIVEAVYILTTLIPLISFVVLCGLYFRHRDSRNPLTRVHLKQAFVAGSLITGIFIFANLLVIFLGGYHSIESIVIFEIYLMLLVPLFVIPGVLGLVKAASGHTYRYPLIGRVILGNQTESE